MPVPRVWPDVLGPPGSRSAWTRARGLPRRFAFRAVNSAGFRLGYRLVREDFYSPLVDLNGLPLEQARSAMGGIAFDSAAQLRYLSENLGPYLAECDIPDNGVPGDLFLRNGAYEAFDAEALYATVRHRRPERVLEIGSGFTTHIIAKGIAANGGGLHQVFDPFARPEIDRLASVSRCSAAEITDAEFAELSAGDILFVDSTHVVKMGSEVNRVVLDAMPALAPGVAVHFHDVYLPWDYPSEVFLYARQFMNEQYLLQAFLALNPSYKILLATHAVGRLHPEEVAALIPSVRAGASPCAFWVERTAAAPRPA